jgi:hypothetical protein
MGIKFQPCSLGRHTQTICLPQQKDPQQKQKIRNMEGLQDEEDSRNHYSDKNKWFWVKHI